MKQWCTRIQRALVSETDGVKRLSKSIIPGCCSFLLGECVCFFVLDPNTWQDDSGESVSREERVYPEDGAAHCAGEAGVREETGKTRPGSRDQPKTADWLPSDTEIWSIIRSFDRTMNLVWLSDSTMVYQPGISCLYIGDKLCTYERNLSKEVLLSGHVP